MRFLSQEWLAHRARLADVLPVTPGVDVRIQHRVVGGPSDVIEYFDHIRDGRLASCALGVDADCDVTIINDYDDELRVLRGTVDPMDLLAEGRVVVLGDQGLLLRVALILQSELVAKLAVELAAVTDVED